MTARPSKFQSIFESDQEPVVEAGPATSATSLPEDTLPPTSPDADSARASAAGTAPNRRPGRPAIGKKSNPNYRQVTAYVRKDLYRDVTDMLYDEGRGRDTKRKEFSELVNELLERWRQERLTSTT